MANKLVLKKSSVAAKVPLATDLVAGELAVNLADAKLYTKDGSGNVILVGSGAGGAVSSVAGKTGAVTLVKGDVGLGNVDNTSDASKPVSTAQQTALDLKSNLSSPTFTGTPAAPTAAVGTNTTQLATTAFVNAEIANDAAPIAHVGSGGTSHAAASTSVAGFMSAADKSKLDGIAAGATANTGTVTGVTGTAPIVSSGGTTPAISISAATTSAAGSMSAADKTKLDGIAAGATANTGTVTSVSGTGTVSGLSLSGTVTTSGSLTLGGTLSASIENITDEHRLFNNMGDNHGTRSAFDAQGAASTVNFGWRYIQGNTNAPSGVGGGQYYSAFVGLGNEYPYNQYGMQFAIPRVPTGGSPYLSVRFEEGGAFGAWSKIYAGYADTAGSATTATTATTAGSITGQANSATITASAGVTGNHIVQRDGNGYIYASYVNHSTSETENPTINSVFVSNGDGWTRKASKAHFISQLGLASQVANGCITENNQTVTSSYTLTSGKNGLSAGPITIASGVTVTIPSGSTWAVV